MTWARYRFQKVTGPQRWRWEYFLATESKADIDEHYREMYERGTRIEWEIGELPPRSVLLAEGVRLKSKIEHLKEQAAEISRQLQKKRGFMSEARMAELNKGTR